MNILKSFLQTLFFASASLIFACGDDSPAANQPVDPAAAASSQTEVHGPEFKAGDIVLSDHLDPAMSKSGSGIYELKCQSCHKLTADRLVGPGWLGVTKRREPHWIMNMITNVDIMLETDAEAQKLLEQCLVRMPNQNLNKEQARQVLEFMRMNDGLK